MSETEYRQLACKYGAKYLLIRSNRRLVFPKLYNNKTYSVYRVDG